MISPNMWYSWETLTIAWSWWIWSNKLVHLPNFRTSKYHIDLDPNRSASTVCDWTHLPNHGIMETSFGMLWRWGIGRMKKQTRWSCVFDECYMWSILRLWNPSFVACTYESQWVLKWRGRMVQMLKIFQKKKLDARGKQLKFEKGSIKKGIKNENLWKKIFLIGFN